MGLGSLKMSLMYSFGVLKTSFSSNPSRYEKKSRILPLHRNAALSARVDLSSVRVSNFSGLCLGIKIVSKFGNIHILVEVTTREPRVTRSPSDTFSTMDLKSE